MMDTVTAAQAINGALRGPNAWFSGVSTDSRSLVPGDLFVAIKGDKFDGHDYVSQAFDRGAAAALVAADRAVELATDGRAAAATLLGVADPVRSLGALAKFWRGRFSLPVVGIAGSNGKTTVKEMIAAILRVEVGAENVLATAGNLNNSIGLPLTVLRLRSVHAAAAIEIGMNHPGETAELSAIAQPTVGVINNAQREHQEFMNSVADVAAEHASLFGALPVDGVAVINADDDFAGFWREVVARRDVDGASLTVRDFGLRAPALISARCETAAWGSLVEVTTPEGAARFELKVPGRHNVSNALAAIAAGTAAGASLSGAAIALAAFRPIRGRLHPRAGIGGATIIDDTYNANPDSVKAAVAVLARAPGPKWMVLGDMGEVGDKGPAFHREIGEYARAAGVNRLLTVGELATHAVAAFGPGGKHYADQDELVSEIEQGPLRGTTVLVKGSRFMAMDRVVERLVEPGQPTAGGH
ncbi:MAG: UDP-N-acetylmuramoyl-tripeptide--D-alanyl-D-alanine ligase [Pseudomonadota bacterium]|nr:UDP-N-acetylmuramoyl-tripeptide--D-alanyl-D-alanine ligase [Pseudomonadota bacterium]